MALPFPLLCAAYRVLPSRQQVRGGAKWSSGGGSRTNKPSAHGLTDLCCLPHVMQRAGRQRRPCNRPAAPMSNAALTRQLYRMLLRHASFLDSRQALKAVRRHTHHDP